VLAVVGATGSTTISYILPGLVYCRLHPKWTLVKVGAAALALLGCIIVPSCLTFIFLFGGDGGR
jgi:amino acid permease